MEARAGRETLWGASSSGNMASNDKQFSDRHLCALVLGCKQAGQPKALSAPSMSVQGSAWWNLAFRTQVFVFF